MKPARTSRRANTATGGIRRCPGEPADNRKRLFALRIGLLACPPSVRIPRHPATQSALIWPGIPRPSGH
ncbi:hypothetical protein FA106_18790, partial [Pseudomonas aeruginosa]|nr:hypothetical protein [Pseudomonas aeruginosa]